jgi:hypothetical protein
MSTIAVILLAAFIALLVVAELAAAVEKRRALRRLPPNTSDGTPVVPTLRERLLVAGFCLFVLGVVVWFLQ